MEGTQLVLAHAIKLAVLVTLVGIVATGRYRKCWSLAAYLMVALVGNSMISFWPELFYNYDFYTAWQATFDVLKLCVALELSHKVLAAFPGAHSRWRAVSFVVLVVTTSAVVAASWNDPVLYAAYHWQPRISAGAIWIFCAIALLAGWHRLPVDAWHYAILVGFIPYLIVFTTVMTVVPMRWSAARTIELADTAAYLLLMLWWAYAAWSPQESVPPLSRHLARKAPLDQPA